MRIVRFKSKQIQPSFGWVFEDQVGLIEGSPFADFQRMEVKYSLASIQLLEPVIPQKIICLGRNYASHAREHEVDVPEVPLIFLKPPSSTIPTGSRIILPPQSHQVEHEAELVAVIGKQGKSISPGNALDYVLGYTIGNDITARDLQRKDGQWTRGKGFDTFCPIGPWIETDFDPSDVMITCYVNNEMRQMASTRDMVFNVRNIIAFVSSVMTIFPGDLIFTGTPSGVGPLEHGDTVEVRIEGIGSLINPVSREP